VKAVRATAWFVAGWLCCFGQGLFGSKLHSMWEDRVHTRKRFDWMGSET
jgi:hypothetical protein